LDDDAIFRQRPVKVPSLPTEGFQNLIMGTTQQIPQQNLPIMTLPAPNTIYTRLEVMFWTLGSYLFNYHEKAGGA
jgi:hypothetical protein